MDELSADLTCEQFLHILNRAIAEAEARIEVYDERAALSAIDTDQKITDARAIAALERPERFRGEHAVADAWLRSSATARRWGRKG